MPELLDVSALNDIQAFWPDSDHIKGHLQGLESNYLSNKSASLDSAKCLLETVCKTIIHENNHIVSDDKGSEVPLDKLPLNRIFSETMRALGILRSTATDIETELFNALVKSIEQVSRYRNHYSANAHGRVSNCEKLSDDMCVMSISTLLSGCLIVFKEHKNQKETNGDVKHTLRPYEAFTAYNDTVDDNSSAYIDEDQSEVVINGDLRFRFSQILFAFERDAYVDIVSSTGGGTE